MRVLLDSHFGDPEALRSNQATVQYLQVLAAAEGLDIQAPTGGVHAKVVLVHVDGETWSAVGSLNGGEISYKVNREVMLPTDLPIGFDRPVGVFPWDWEHSPSF